MQESCEIVKDLLPLFVDGLLSDTSKEFVNEHIGDCADCREILRKVNTPITLPTSDASKTKASNPFKMLKRKITKRTITVSLISVAVTAVVVFAVILACIYMQSDWMGVDRFFGVDTISLISTGEQQERLLNMIAETENYNADELHISTISNQYSWRRIDTHSSVYRFLFLLTYKGEEFVIDVFAEQSFFSILNIVNYGWCNVDNDGILTSSDGLSQEVFSSIFPK